MKVLIPCVNYADMLAVTLPAWLAVLPDEAEVTIVTALSDMETGELVRGLPAVGPQTRLHYTDAWYRDGAKFNKARAMDEALGIGTDDCRLQPGEPLLALDVDVYPFGTFPDLDQVAEDRIYGCARYQCDAPADLEAHIAGWTDRRDLVLLAPKVRGASYVTAENTPENVVDTASKVLGYFQLCRWEPRIRFGSHKTAGKYDLDFRNQFPRECRVGLEAIYVLHLGAQDRRNWSGRVLPRWGASA